MCWWPQDHRKLHQILISDLHLYILLDCIFMLLSFVFSNLHRKSTFFNVLTKSEASAENFPFCTINPNESKCEAAARFVGSSKNREEKTLILKTWFFIKST